MIFHVPGGGANSRMPGFAALLFNGFLIFFTSFWFLDPNGGPRVPPLPVLIFLSVFWLAGRAFVLVAEAAIYPHLFVAGTGTVVLQRILFGRKSIAEAELAAGSRAGLSEAYRTNDEPVYEVVVNGKNKRIKFGLALAHFEKDWMVAKSIAF